MNLRPRRLWIVLCAWLACACGGDSVTELMLVVDSDWAEIARVSIDVEGFEGADRFDISVQDDWFPRTLGLVHAGGPLGPIAVTVRAHDADGTLLLTEPRSQIYFRRGKVGQLRIELLMACHGVCAQGEACASGGGAVRCVDSGEAAVVSAWDANVKSLSPDLGDGNGDADGDTTGGDGGVSGDGDVTGDGDGDVSGDGDAVGDGDGDAAGDGDGDVAIECGPDMVLRVDTCVALPHASCQVVMHDVSTYVLCDDEQGWNDARARCQSLGADLAVVTTPEEDSFVRMLADEDFIWVGGHDSEQEEAWTWVDGKRFWEGDEDGYATDASGNGPCDHPEDEGCMYAAWDSDEPDDSSPGDGEPDCLAIGTPVIGDEGWYDRGCEESERYLCELP